jgi:Uncharacterized conserved protein (DUF2181)
MCRWNIHQPVTFTVHASLAHRSLPQLRWLMEMVSGSTLTVVSSISDTVTVDQLLTIRQYLPKHAVFYDIPSALRVQVIAVQDNASGFHNKQLSPTKSQSFIADQWKVFIVYDKYI